MLGLGGELEALVTRRCGSKLNYILQIVKALRLCSNVEKLISHLLRLKGKIQKENLIDHPRQASTAV